MMVLQFQGYNYYYIFCFFQRRSPSHNSGGLMKVLNFQTKWAVDRRGSRISARGGRQGIDDLIWDRDERFLT